jgi:hypothetical protein
LCVRRGGMGWMGGIAGGAGHPDRFLQRRRPARKLRKHVPKIAGL